MLVDFLDPCPTCDQKGYVVVERIRAVPTHHPSCTGGSECGSTCPVPEPVPEYEREHCSDCVGGLVVSEDDIEKVAERLWLEDRITRPQDFDIRVWSDLDDAIREHYRDMARAAVTTLIQEWRTESQTMC